MNQTPEVALEVLTPSALETLERASIDVQVSTAHRFPRSLELFKKRALDMVQQDLETAESCIYSRPVGKGDDGKQKYAEGASIRMAEIVAACYGNIRFGARIVEQTERYVKAEGVAHDLESNTAAKSEAMESTVKRNGQPYDERMRIVVAKAALSKALRDAIFRVVPRALCKSIYDAALKVIAGQNKTLDQRRTMAKQWLLGLHVEDARAFAVLNVKGWSEIGEEQLLILTGLKTAMKENDITLLEAFPLITAAQTGEVLPKQPTAPPPQPATQTAAAPQPPAKPAEAPKPDDGDLGPQNAATATQKAQCRHCGAVVENISQHECPQMKEAITGAVTETAQTTAQEENALEAIKGLCKATGITEATVFEFCKLNKLAKPEQTSLLQLADSKLKKLCSSWPAIVEELQRIQGAAAK